MRLRTPQGVRIQASLGHGQLLDDPTLLNPVAHWSMDLQAEETPRDTFCFRTFISIEEKLKNLLI
jgi:hypothetical protein